MLKGWSESNLINYFGFSHTAPNHFPFGDKGAFKTPWVQSILHKLEYGWIGINSQNSYEIYSISTTRQFACFIFSRGDAGGYCCRQNIEELRRTRLTLIFGRWGTPCWAARLSTRRSIKPSKHLTSGHHTHGSCTG